MCLIVGGNESLFFFLEYNLSTPLQNNLPGLSNAASTPLERSASNVDKRFPMDNGSMQQTVIIQLLNSGLMATGVAPEQIRKAIPQFLLQSFS